MQNIQRVYNPYYLSLIGINTTRLAPGTRGLLQEAYICKLSIMDERRVVWNIKGGEGMEDRARREGLDGVHFYCLYFYI